MAPDNAFLNKCLYFGCWKKGTSGHYLVDRYNHSVRQCVFHLYGLSAFHSLDWLDGFFNNRTQSKAQLIHLPGWTIASMPDNSVDSRGGSNAAFLVPMERATLNEVLEVARYAFKDQVERIEAVAPITELEKK
jgi:hypothetical protein